MHLSPHQIDEFEDRGVLLFPGLLDEEEVAVLNAERPGLLARTGPEAVRDPESGAVRLVYGAHGDSAPFDIASRLPRVLRPVQQLLGDDAYIHQSRFDPKPGFAGDPWPWHQDFGTWQHEDGLPAPRCLTAAIFLDDATAVNGPLLVVPGSHRHGALQEAAPEPDAEGGDVMRVSERMLDSLAAHGGIEALTGPAGTVAFLHASLVHGATNNVTPWSRAVMCLTYNAVSNAPADGAAGRAWFHCNPDRTPLTPVDPDALHEIARARAAPRMGAG